MYIIYPDEHGAGGKFALSELDPTMMYMKHYENSLFLDFIIHNPEATWIERQRATKELDICDRKMNYWKRMSGFEQERANNLAIVAKRKWEK